MYRQCQSVLAKHIDGLVQEKRNSSALAMELRLSCTNPSTFQCIFRLKTVDMQYEVYLRKLYFLNDSHISGTWVRSLSYQM